MPVGFSTAVEPRTSAVWLSPPPSTDAGAKPPSRVLAAATGVKPGLSPGAATTVPARPPAARTAPARALRFRLMFVKPPYRCVRPDGGGHERASRDRPVKAR